VTKPFHCDDVDLAKPVPVLVAGIIAASMADGLVPIASGGQARVDAIFVRLDEGALTAALMIGLIVACCTLASMRSTT